MYFLVSCYLWHQLTWHLVRAVNLDPGVRGEEVSRHLGHVHLLLPLHNPGHGDHDGNDGNNDEDGNNMLLLL